MYMFDTFVLPGVIQIFSMFFLGGGLGVPLGIPPAAEDPVMARAAPKECLFYLTWSGVSEPDLQSRNPTEQLLAEKEVRQSLKLLESQIVAGIRAASAGDPQAAAMVDDLHTVAKAVLSGPTAVFISKVEPSKKGSPEVRGGAIVNLGQQAPEITKALARLESRMQSTGDRPKASPRATRALGRLETLMQKKGVPKAGRDPVWHRFPLGMHDPHADQGGSIHWAVKDRCLIVGLGEGEAEKIVDRVRHETPEWLQQIRRQLAVPRPANLIYVNIAELVRVAGGGDRELASILDALGLARLQWLAGITGLDDAGCINRTQLTIDGDLKGLLSFFTVEPLTKNHLKPIPKDATIALAARLDAAKLYKELMETAGRLEPQGQQELLGGVRQLEEGLKLKIYEDILQSLGDTWRVYASRSEGNLIFTGLTAVVDVRNHDRLVAANAKLVFGSLFGGMAKEATQPGRGRSEPLIKQTRYGEQTIFYLARGGEFMPFSPAWCITDKEFVAALYPQNVKAYLERAAQTGPPSLADAAILTEQFERAKPIVVSYVDTQAAFNLAYPIAQILLSFASNGMGPRGDLSLDISVLPPAPSIGRHLRPMVTTVARNTQGIVMETHQTLPIGSLTVFPPLMMYFWLERSIPSGPLPTQQNRSMDNLKMLGMALMNYHGAYNAFPSTAAGQKPNQPPVSWRVLILPYVEELALYQQYHFDQPWDSEANKKLIAHMPEVFKAPGSRKSTEGKTNYLAAVGGPYALAADQGRKMAAFTDGTSNTILLVEAIDERAVPWTKPEDFTPDKSKPATGLVGLRPDAFLALAADGAVHLVPADTSAETLHALFTRAGGEVAAFPNPDVAPGVAEPMAPSDAPPPTRRVEPSPEPPQK
jgi:hypothetical protein